MSACGTMVYLAICNLHLANLTLLELYVAIPEFLSMPGLVECN